MTHIVTVGNPDILRLLTAGPLARPAVTHEVVTSGREALDAVRRRRTALLILDANMPDDDGLEVCREVRRNEELAGCRVMLVVAGATSRSLLDQMAAAGCDDFVVAPVGGVELCTHVEDLLELPRRRRRRVTVELLAWVEAGARVFEGQAENLSLSGAKVRLETPLGPVDSVRVRLKREEHEQFMAVDARVMWQLGGGRELGLMFTDPTPETRQQLEALVLWDVAEEEDLVRVYLEGDFVETTDLAPLARRLGPRVDFDAAGVHHVNSHGARRWVAFLESLGAQHEYTFSRCSAGFTTQAGFLPGFLGRGRIVSFMAPYHCEECERDETRLLQAAALVPEGGDFALPRFRCPQCGGSLTFDEIPERYLACLSPSTAPDAPPGREAGSAEAGYDSSGSERRKSP